MITQNTHNTPVTQHEASSGDLTSTSHIIWAALMTKCGQRQTTCLLNMLDMPGIPQRAWKKAEGTCWPACVLHATCHIQSRTQPNATHNTRHTELLGQVAKALSNDILHNNRSICGLNSRKEIHMATHTCSELFPHM